MEPDDECSCSDCMEKKIEQLQQEVERLKGLLRDAAVDLADWGQYVPEYFVEKHKLDDDIQKYRIAGEVTK